MHKHRALRACTLVRQVTRARAQLARAREAMDLPPNGGEAGDSGNESEPSRYSIDRREMADLVDARG